MIAAGLPLLRRSFGCALPLLLPLLLLAWSACQARDASTDSGSLPPNIVLLLADDLGYGELGCYGQQKIATPRLDALAKEGVRFAQAYTGAPVCAPARCVLMTGKSSGRAYVRDNQERKPEGQEPLPRSEQTIAEILHSRGYATGCFGKWGLGYPGSEGDPLQRGFDRFYGYNCQRHAHDHYPHFLYDNDLRVDLPGNDGSGVGDTYAEDRIADEAVAFVRQNRDRPFFCYVPFTLPHLALQVPDDVLARYRGQFDETPYEGKSYRPHPTPRACYAAMITHLDTLVGRVLDAIEDEGLRDRTIVLFLSDNGPTHLPQQADVAFFGSQGGLRGLKGSVYEGGIRVPMLVRGPTGCRTNSVTDHVACMQDVMATVCDIVGAEAPRDADGVSFWPLLCGNEPSQQRHDALLWDFPGYGGQLALRMGKWKAVRRDLRKDRDAPLELYDLESDPGETSDVASQHPELALDLRARMTQMRAMPQVESFRFGDYAPR